MKTESNFEVFRKLVDSSLKIITWAAVREDCRHFVSKEDGPGYCCCSFSRDFGFERMSRSRGDDFSSFQDTFTHFATKSALSKVKVKFAPQDLDLDLDFLRIGRGFAAEPVGKPYFALSCYYFGVPFNRAGFGYLKNFIAIFSAIQGLDSELLTVDLD